MRDKWQYGSTEACSLNQKCGPNEWHLKPEFAACAEQGTQSPIDLKLGTMDAPPHMSLPNPLRPTGGHCNEADFVLNEHTDEVIFEETCHDKYSLPFVSSTSNVQKKTFYLKQFHYHSPSEHTWDGKYFPMEVHHVHHSNDGQALVIAIFIAAGTPQSFEEIQAAHFLLEMQALMPGIKPSAVNKDGEGNLWKQLVEDTPNLDPYSKFINISGGYLYYDGSFTTPPCTPSTHWIILPKPVVVPQSTIDLYRKLINSNPYNQLTPCLGSSASPPFHPAAGKVDWNASLGCNARPIQPLHGVTNMMRQLYSVAPNSSTGLDTSAVAAFRPSDNSVPATSSPWIYVVLVAIVVLALLGMAVFLVQSYCKEEEESDSDDDYSS